MNKIKIVYGDLLNQPVDVIVNPWNRNIIPWWLLIPHGVSGAIKRRAGFAPFVELAKHGSIPVGGAVLTSAGKLPFKGIIHVAGINFFWRATPASVEKSVCSAMKIVNEQRFKSVAFPMIGAGTGGAHLESVQQIIIETLNEHEFRAIVYLVVYDHGLTRVACTP